MENIKSKISVSKNKKMNDEKGKKSDITEGSGQKIEKERK
jgi:hypothetical protein